MLLLALLGGGYSLYLSQLVRVKFEGKRWAVPARVYGRPLELYAGAPVTTSQLQAELQRLGYRNVTHPRAAAEWSRNRGRFLVRTRAFRFADGEAPPRYLDIRVDGDRVRQLSDAASGGALDLVRLEAPEIGSIYPAHNEDRVLLRRADIPDLLVQALLAVEDRKFFEHHGIDPSAVARAAWANLRAGRVVQGGSTLTQQLVKNFFLSGERSFWRKANEAAMALIVDARYSKDDILEAYANEIYLGQDGPRAIHGFGLAAHFYFNRPLTELDLPRLALLVAMIKGPSLYDPRRHPERARARRDLVLQLLAEQGHVSVEAAAQAVAAPLGVVAAGQGSSASVPAFIDLVRRQLRRDYHEEDLTSEGLRIFTTLDPWAQQQVEQALEERLRKLEDGRRMPRGTLEAALVVVTPQAGEVLVLVGGRERGYAGFNRALDAVRPIGSLAKPAVYLAALSQPSRYTLITPIDDRALSLRQPNGSVWAPQNYDKQEHGAVPLHRALANSYNLATVRLGLAVGLERVIDTLRALGVERPLLPYPSTLLGAVSLSPLEVAQVYQTLAAGGFRSPLRAILEVLDAQGEPLQRYPLTVRQAAGAGPIFLVNRILQEVVLEGTGRGLRNFLPEDLGVAGKTGTTDELRDSWFAGFAGDMVAVAWVGRDDNQPAGLTGAAGALRVWGDAMRRLRPAPLLLTPPDTVADTWIDPASRLLAVAECEGAVQIPFVRGSEPRDESSCVRQFDTSVKGFFDRLFE